MAAFFADYIDQIARLSGSARLRVEVTNNHLGLRMRFNPIDASIIVDNFISNSKRAKAFWIKFDLSPLERKGLQIHVTDNGRGLVPGTTKGRIFEMGYTTTQGSGLGLYHIRQVLGEMGGTIELDESDPGSKGIAFLIRIVGGGKGK